MVCKNCGKELSEGANFCSACGATCNVTPDAAQSVPNTAQADGDSKSAESALAVNQETSHDHHALPLLKHMAGVRQRIDLILLLGSQDTNPWG